MQVIFLPAAGDKGQKNLQRIETNARMVRLNDKIG